MTLCDAGPMIALLDKNDRDHARCSAALRALPTGGMLTTWPCFTEAMYILGHQGGWDYQERLWIWIKRELISLHVPEAHEIVRMRELMERYADAPMDLADASLVAVAERLKLTRIFTLDSHFRAYRLADTGAFDVVP